MRLINLVPVLLCAVSFSTSLAAAEPASRALWTFSADEQWGTWWPGDQGPIATHNPFADLQSRLEQKTKS